ncbi:hypothetical protein Sjap_020341 [Stephania japonica]|uniref:Uncharacterized protein n=1 Tax=Stephania japonica TaxID=461633 RepID=A0AAP0F3A0_9MAGN
MFNLKLTDGTQMKYTAAAEEFQIRLSQLEPKHAAETNALEPPHKYVSCVIVDEQPLYENDVITVLLNFISYVCAACEGTAVPTPCKELLLQIAAGVKRDQALPIIFAEQSSNSYLSEPCKIMSSLASSEWQQMNVCF